MSSEGKTYKRSIGLILPGFGNKPAVSIDEYNGKQRAKFTIRDLIRDKIVTITLWENTVEAKRPYLVAGALVVADGVYSCREKKNSQPGDDNRLHSISVSRPDGLWIQPSADRQNIEPEFEDATADDLPLDFDEAMALEKNNEF